MLQLHIDQFLFKVFLLIFQETFNKLSMRRISTMLIAEPTVINLGTNVADFIIFCFEFSIKIVFFCLKFLFCLQNLNIFQFNLFIEILLGFSELLVGCFKFLLILFEIIKKFIALGMITNMSWRGHTSRVGYWNRFFL